MKLRESAGQTIVFTIIAMSSVLGMTAFVLDLGSWFRSQRDLQAVADAAALAGAQSLPDDPGTAVAQAIANANKNGFTLASGGITISSNIRPNDTIKVHVGRTAPSFFAKVIGVNGADVGANATADAENISQARYVAPIAVDYQHPLLGCSKGGGAIACNPTYGVETTLNLVDLKSGGSSGAGNFGLVDLTNSNGSVGSTDLADWIEYGYGDSLPLGNYDGVPSTKYHDSQMRDALDIRSGDVLLFPVYDKITGPGSNAVYHVIGWVGFRVDSFDTQSQNGTLTGQFVRFIAQGLDSSDSTQADFGVKKVTLVG
jgi:Flp pilus assembly protein TadG